MCEAFVKRIQRKILWNTIECSILNEYVITFGEGLLKAKCIEIKDEGIGVLEMMYDGIFYEIQIN